MRPYSRDYSRPEFSTYSRSYAHPGANNLPSLIRPDPAPGLSSISDGRGLRILELRPQETPTLKTTMEPNLRDLAILQELDSHRYLDRAQIQALFFPGPRSCQVRLHKLVQRGLVRAWLAAGRPGRLCQPSVFLLSRRGAAVLAAWRDEDPRPLIKRAEHALERRFHLVHQLEANQFFVSLAAATRSEPELGLYHWVGEHEIAAAYAEGGDSGPIPDGWGRLLTTAKGELLLHLEWDRGTEQPRRLRAKLGAYRRYFIDRLHASANQVLLVTPAATRELQVQRLLREHREGDRECCRFWTTSVQLLASAGPLDAIWADGQTGVRIRLPGLSGLPRSSRRLVDCIGKPGWWLRRPGGGAGA